jgi:hypothetical protein
MNITYHSVSVTWEMQRTILQETIHVLFNFVPCILCIVNKQMHTWSTVYYSVLYLSLLHVSTPMRHPQGALIRSVPAKLHKHVHAVFVACFKIFSHSFFRIVKTLKHKNCLSYNRLYFRNNSRNFLRWPYMQTAKIWTY